MESTKEKIIEYADKIISTINTAVLPDGSNVSHAPPPKVDPHVCNKSYSQVTDTQKDLSDLIAHAKDTLAALSPIVSIHVMESKSVDLDILKICNQKPSST